MCLGCGYQRIFVKLQCTSEEEEFLNSCVPQFNKKLQLRRKQKLLPIENVPDYIIRGGNIYTIDSNNSKVEAVAMKGPTIIFAGKEEEAMKLKNFGTRIIDLEGKTMLPGFVEPHAHTSFAYFDKWNDLGPFVNPTTSDVKKTLIEAVKKAEAANQSCMCQLFDPLITPGEKIPVGMKDLDKFSTKVPIFILQSNGHIGHANSLAFQKAGVTKQTPDPPHARFIRDQNGNLTGQIQEMEALKQFNKISPNVPVDDYKNSIKALFNKASQKGVTSFHDCGIGALSGYMDYCLLLNVMQQKPPMRFSGYLISSNNQKNQWKDLKPEFEDDFVRINGMKFWVDGSTQGGSAYLRDNYLKPQWGKGFPNYSQENLNDYVLQAHQQGWQVGIHCNGDAAIDMALQAFEYAQKHCSNDKLRHRTEHTTFCQEDQFKRMKTLNVYPSFLIGHVYYYGKVFRDELVGEKRANLTDSLKTALKYDRRPSIHSDYNCQPIDPIRCIYNAASRIMRDNGEVLNEKQCITNEQAVKCMTIDAAFQCHMDNIVGSIEKGKLADFVVLDQDIMKVAAKDIINIQVLQTWFNGQLVYEKASK